jgi:hypothetical protein
VMDKLSDSLVSVWLLVLFPDFPPHTKTPHAHNDPVFPARYTCVHQHSIPTADLQPRRPRRPVALLPLGPWVMTSGDCSFRVGPGDILGFLGCLAGKIHQPASLVLASLNHVLICQSVGFLHTNSSTFVSSNFAFAFVCLLIHPRQSSSPASLTWCPVWRLRWDMVSRRGMTS